jgi:hypothetical protein
MTLRGKRKQLPGVISLLVTAIYAPIQQPYAEAGQCTAADDASRGVS